MTTIQHPPVFLNSASSILTSARTLIQHLRDLQDGLVNSITPASATFANAMLPIAGMDNEFRSQANLLGFYSSVSEDETLREASTRARILLDEFQSETYLRRDIFQLVDAVRQREESLDQESALLLTRIYDRHVQSGIAIEDQGQRSRFKEIQGRLSQIRAEFLENINGDQSHICFTPEELEGVPENMLSRLEKTEQDHFKVYLADPGDTALLSHANKAPTRKRLFMACQTRCSENIPLLKEAIVLRHEAANLLGFPNHAALRLQERMVKSSDTVQDFLDELRDRLAPGGLDTLRALGDLKKKSGTGGQRKEHHPEQSINPWDRDFYQHLMIEQQLSISGKQIREYFPAQTTISRMLRQYSLLFGLQFNELTGKNRTPEMSWHEDVQLFSVHEDEAGGGHFLGYLYLDLFFRPGKTPQASCWPLQPVSIIRSIYFPHSQLNTFFQGFTKQDGTRHYPVTALLCAFDKPTSNKPSLLRHFDVVTTFHELGHGIHDLVSKTKYARFHGSLGVPVDFGEMPSQMLEQWCWQPSQLKYLSCHFSHLDEGMLRVWEQENEGASRPELQMSEATIEGIIRSRRLNFGPLFQLDQLHRAAFDMAINRTSSLEDAKHLDPTAIWNDLGRTFGLTTGTDADGDDAAPAHTYTTNTHLMSDDYEAGYYVYLFSQVYAADLFYSHFKGDIMDGEVGRRYRYTILEKGGSQNEMQSITSCLGREPSSQAFNHHLLGLP